MRIEFLTAWLLILGSYTTATGQMGVPAASFRPDGKAGSFSSTEQSEKDESHQALARARRTLLTATKVLVVREPFSYSSSKAEQAFRKALVKCGRFQLVHEAETADLIVVISDYSSSRAKWVERISENVAIFAAGSTPDVDARPLWAVTELGPKLGQRPTGKLVEDLRKYLTELEESVVASYAPSALSPSEAH